MYATVPSFAERKTFFPGHEKVLCAMQSTCLYRQFPNQIARVTLPERRHREQTLTWHGVPLITAFTRRTFGFQVRLERLWEWETLIPKVTPFPQISHFAIFLHLLIINSGNGHYNTTSQRNLQEDFEKNSQKKKFEWATIQHCQKTRLLV